MRKDILIVMFILLTGLTISGLAQNITEAPDGDSTVTMSLLRGASTIKIPCIDQQEFGVLAGKLVVILRKYNFIVKEVDSNIKLITTDWSIVSLPGEELITYWFLGRTFKQTMKVSVVVNAENIVFQTTKRMFGLTGWNVVALDNIDIDLLKRISAEMALEVGASPENIKIEYSDKQTEETLQRRNVPTKLEAQMFIAAVLALAVIVYIVFKE